MPLSELPALINYAEEREAEEATRSLYIAQFIVSKLSGAEPMGYDAYIAAITNNQTMQNNVRSAEEIDKELSDVEKMYRLSHREEV